MLSFYVRCNWHVSIRKWAGMCSLMLQARTLCQISIIVMGQQRSLDAVKFCKYLPSQGCCISQAYESRSVATFF